MTWATRNFLSSTLVAVSLCAASTASAGGFMVPGAGPQAQARAGAFVAKADDGTALAHNPAGFAKLDGTHVLVGANFVGYDIRFARAGSYEASGDLDPGDYEGQPYPAVELDAKPNIGIGSFQAIPSIIVSSDLGHPEWPIRAAFGFFAPQAYPVRSFASEVAVPGATDLAPGPQRYDIVSQDARTVLPSVAVAYSVMDNLDVALRASWGLAATKGSKVIWSVRNYEEASSSDSLFVVDAKDNFVPAFGLGLLYRLGDVELGANYNSAVNVHAKGTGNSTVGGAGIDGLVSVPVDDQFALCAKGGVVGALKACIDFKIPQMATLGARYILRDAAGEERGDIEFDLRWEDWSSAGTTQFQIDGKLDTDGGFLLLNESLNHHGYKDVLSFRLGGHYQIPVAGMKLHLRAGASYDTATAPDSWQRVDQDGKARTILATGIALETSRFRIDIGGGIGIEPTIEVEQCLPASNGPTLTTPGCTADGTETPFDQRQHPDPGQPLQGPLNQVESPFNAGTYESSYTLFSLGVTTWF